MISDSPRYERLLASTHPVQDPDAAAEGLARGAAKQAALISGSLALPPGPWGMLTVLPDVYLIWKVQRQLVAGTNRAMLPSAAYSTS